MNTFFDILKYGKIILSIPLIAFLLYCVFSPRMSLENMQKRKSEKIRKKLIDGKITITEMEYTSTGKMCTCMYGYLQNDNRLVTIYQQEQTTDYVNHQLINPRKYKVGKEIACKYYYEGNNIIAFIK